MATRDDFDVVTGAYSYTGKYITERLLARGRRVRTLTGHPNHPHPFGDRVPAFAYDFADPDRLVATLRGARTLYNSYWVRFEHGDRTFAGAVANTRVLLRAAATAGVQRIVHVSIANPALDSPFAYYRGKAALEQSVRESGLSYAILRPTVIFGKEDILVNNMAWCLRHFPFFGVPGDGQYKMQPIFVEEMADLAVEAGTRSDNTVFDTCGPEVLTFDDWLTAIAANVGVTPRLWHLPPTLARVCAGVLGWFVGDVVLTREEVGGLMANLLESREPARGKTRLTEWLRSNRLQVGAQYASELARHYR